ncbi:MAG TPA: hypothetical protein V6D16_09765, partial [Candidatus Obscuribacterales bacterium]
SDRYPPHQNFSQAVSDLCCPESGFKSKKRGDRLSYKKLSDVTEVRNRWNLLYFAACSVKRVRT